MTAVNHIATGALIGTAIGNPWLALPVAFVSHFMLDAIPHFGAEAPNVNARNRDALFRKVFFVDATLAVVLMVWLVASGAWLALLCGIVAYLPDVAWLYRGYFEHKTGVHKRRNWFNQLHKSIQWSESRWGLAVEATWLFGSAILIGILI